MGATTLDRRLRLSGIAPLSEAVLSPDGTVPVCLATPGWGASGFYSTEVLKEAVDGQVFQRGLHMYWDHPTRTEEFDRPERSLRDLAGVLTEDATWNDRGFNGPGIYSSSRVFKHFGEALEEIAPHTGLSMRYYGTSHEGETPDGDTGEIIDAILVALSVDFVTLPGRGGKVKAKFESARVVESRPGKRAEEQEEEMGEEDTRRLHDDIRRLENELREAVTARDAATTRAETAERERDESRTETARLRESVVTSEARDLATDKLAKVKGMPDITQRRLARSLSANPPVTESGALDRSKLEAAVEQAVRDEAEYISKVRGLGSDPEAVWTNQGPGDGGEETSFEEAFKDFGLSEAEAKVAGGRA